MGLPARDTQRDCEALLAKVGDIRTLPPVAMRVNELINDPNSSSGDIAEVLRKDQVLTAKVLRLVNSGYYSIPGGVKDVQRALAFLGYNTLAQLVLSLSVFSLFPAFEAEGFSLTEFWKHALATGICSELLARQLRVGKPEEAFTCGLLHDVGKLVHHEVAPASLLGIVREARQSNRAFFAVERELGVPDHARLGEAVADHWGLPQLIRQAIRHHHHDVSGMDSVLASEKPMIQIVRLANALSIRLGIGHSGDCSGGEPLPELMAPLKFSREDLPALEEKLRREMEKGGALLNAYR